VLRVDAPVPLELAFCPHAAKETVLRGIYECAEQRASSAAGGKNRDDEEPGLGRTTAMTRLWEVGSRRLAAIVASGLVAWGCEPRGQSSQGDGSDEAGSAYDAADDATEAATDDAGGNPGFDATVSQDSAAGGGPLDAPLDGPGVDAAPVDSGPGVDAAPVDSGPGVDAAPVDAGCSLAAQRLAVTSSAGGSLANPFVVRASCRGSTGTTVDTAPVPNGFTLTNTSTLPVSWTAQASSAYFSLDNHGSTLAAGDSATVTVTAVALSAYPPGETVDDVVVVTEDGPGACAHLLPVREAFEGYFFLPASLNYGDVALGRSSTLHVTATFTGGSLFAGVLSASPTDFLGSVQAGPAPITGLDVTFAPTALGLRSGTVSFSGFMNPVCTPPISASGTGVPACDGGAACGDGGV
jgi:hypothetical protein